MGYAQVPNISKVIVQINNDLNSMEDDEYIPSAMTSNYYYSAANSTKIQFFNNKTKISSLADKGSSSNASNINLANKTLTPNLVTKGLNFNKLRSTFFKKDYALKAEIKRSLNEVNSSGKVLNIYNNVLSLANFNTPQSSSNVHNTEKVSKQQKVKTVAKSGNMSIDWSNIV